MVSDFGTKFQNQTSQFVTSLGRDGLSGTLDKVGESFQRNIEKLDSDTIQRQFDSRVELLNRADRAYRDQQSQNVASSVTSGVVLGAQQAFANMPRQQTQRPIIINVPDGRGGTKQFREVLNEGQGAG
jgi:hypothetical protein